MVGRSGSRMAGMLACALLGTAAAAAQRVWTGGGADDNLSTAANWEGGVAPASGDVLVFRGNVRTAPVNDYDPETTAFETLVFSNTCATAETSAPFTLSGNKIVLTGGTTFNRLGSAVYAVGARASVTDVLDLEIELPQNARNRSKFGGNNASNHHLLFKKKVSATGGGLLRSMDQMKGLLTFEGPVDGFAGVIRVNGGGGQIWLRSSENRFVDPDAVPTHSLNEGELKVDGEAAAGGGAVTFSFGQAEYTTPGKFIVNAQTDTRFTGDMQVYGPNHLRGAGYLLNAVAGTTATFEGQVVVAGSRAASGHGEGTGAGVVLGGAGNGVLAGEVASENAWLYKEGEGTWTLAGASCATGAVTVRAGTLLVDGDHASARGSSVAAGAALGGTGRLGDVAFAAGARFVPTGLAAAERAPLRAAALDLAGAVKLARPASLSLEAGTYTVLTYDALTGAGGFDLEDGAWPDGTTVAVGATAVAVTVPTDARLDWAGAKSAVWDEATANWTRGGAEEVFAPGDAVTFGDGAAQTAVSLASEVRPGGVFVTGARDYAFTAAAPGAGIAGGGGLVKTGAGVLTLATTNAYAGETIVRGGALVLAGALDGTTVRVGVDAALTNRPTARMEGGGRLLVEGTAWLDGVNDLAGGLYAQGPVTVRHPRALGTGDVFLSGASSSLSFSGEGGEAGRGRTLVVDVPNNNEQNPFETVNVRMAWLGDVRIKTAAFFIRGKGGKSFGLTFGEPGCATTVRGDGAAAGVSLRGDGVATWHSRLDMPEATYYQTDANTSHFHASGNRWGALSVAVGTIVCHATDALAPAPVTMGQTWQSAVFNPVLDLGGFDQTITGLRMRDSIDASSQTVRSDVPATLTVSNDVAETTRRMQCRIVGAVSLRKAGAGTWTLGARNDSTGSVQVAAGTLEVAADDALPRGEASALEIAAGAKVVLADGVHATVTRLVCNGVMRPAGVYCGEGGAAGVRLDRFFGPGGGTLTVRRGSGLTILLR